MTLAGHLLSVLGLLRDDSPHLVQLIGGGGKTTLMFELAHGLQARGVPVLTTTTTRIGPPQAERSPAVIFANDHDEFLPLLGRTLARHGHATLAQAQGPHGKLLGLSPATLEMLLDWDPRLRVIAECDGSAGRSLKAHGAHEPVLSMAPSLVIAVVGLDILGAPLDDLHVHRAALLARRLVTPLGTPLGISAVAEAIAGPAGYLPKLPHTARGAVVLTKLSSDNRGAARTLADALWAHPGATRLERIVAVSWSELLPLYPEG